MGRRKKKESHAAHAVRSHIAAHHPLCPGEIVSEIVARIEGRLWEPPVTLGEAVGIVADNYVRHQLTDYEQLMRKHRLTRNEARLAVRSEVTAIIESWRQDNSLDYRGPVDGALQLEGHSMSGEDEGDRKDSACDDIPVLFATIHHRSEARPDGYTPDDIAWLNVEGNRHLPELHKALLEEFRRQFPDDARGRE